MDCLEPSVTTQRIVQGEAVPVNVRLVTEDPGDPFDLTDATEIVAVFQVAGPPGYIEKKLSLSQIVIDSAAGGRFHVLMSAVDTQSLVPGAAQSFEVRVTSPTKGYRIIQLLGVLNIVPSLFPTAP